MAAVPALVTLHLDAEQFYAALGRARAAAAGHGEEGVD